MATPCILESPYGGEHVERNVRYAQACLRYLLDQGYAPMASHLLYTQAYDDANAEQRRRGMNAGFAWMPLSTRTVVFTDYGITPGMEAGIQLALTSGKPVNYLTLPGWVE